VDGLFPALVGLEGERDLLRIVADAAEAAAFAVIARQRAAVVVAELNDHEVAAFRVLEDGVPQSPR
jgi:hypothetical protein